jgi:hypothetical protein
MSSFWYAGLILSYCCLVTVNESTSADSSMREQGFEATRTQIGNYLMLAAEEPIASLSKGSDEAKSKAGKRQEMSTSTSTAVPANWSGKSSDEVDSSPQNPMAPVGTAAAIPRKILAAGKSTLPEAKAPSLLQRMEGREGDLATWAVIAAVFFFLGWIAGGINSRRRERLRRTRLRF